MDVGQIINKLIEHGFGVSYLGNTDYEIIGVCNVKSPKANHLSYYDSNFYNSILSKPTNCSIITSFEMPWRVWTSQISTDFPKEAFAIVSSELLGNKVSKRKPPIIGKNVTIFCDIGSLGVPGVGYVWWRNKRYNMPQVGDTIINDGCTIGANVTICRGSLQDTVLENDVIVGHGVTIGHGSYIRSESFIGNNSVICGSVVVGRRCWISPNVTVNPGVIIGASSIIASGSVVTCDVHPKSIMAGSPAKKTGEVKEGVKYNGMPKF